VGLTFLDNEYMVLTDDMEKVGLFVLGEQVLLCKNGETDIGIYKLSRKWRWEQG
jgi:hypothetical protein